MAKTAKGLRGKLKKKLKKKHDLVIAGQKQDEKIAIEKYMTN